MHELSIALSIIELAEEEAAKRAVRVEAVHLRLGPLAGVVKEALLSSYEMAVTGTALEGSRLVIEDVPLIVYCATCAEQRVLPSLQHFCCPVCQTPTGNVLQGRELQVTALEVEG